MSIFRIALPGFDVHRGKLEQMVLDSAVPSPKIDTTADLSHAGIIHLNWTDTTPIADGTTKTIYSFKHNCSQIPSVFANYTWDGGSGVRKGVLPLQYGALGMILLDADATNINLKYYSFDSSSTAISAFVMEIRYYVMSDLGY